MATIEKIEQQLTKADARLDEATKNLKTFEEGEDDGKWLKKLRRRLDEEEWKNEGQKKRWEDRVKKLEEEKERLEKNVDDWKKQVEEWGKALRGFGGGEGNEQIA